jgi:hypothetical protein
MKMRINRPPASTASGTVNHQDTAALRCIRYHSSAYGTKVLSSCHTARQVDGCWYLSITCFHDAFVTGKMMGGTTMGVVPMGVAMESVAMTVLRKLASRATAAQNEL